MSNSGQRDVSTENDRAWQRNTPEARAHRRAAWEQGLATNSARDSERRWTGVDKP